MLNPRAEGDDLTVRFDVVADGTAQDITGATLEGGAMSQSGAKVAADTQITDAGNGKAKMYFQPGNLSAGKWYLHFRVTLSTGETQSWQETIKFTPSYL